MATGRKTGSGGQRRKGLTGRGPTPRAEDRVYHKAYRGRQAAGQRSAGRRPPAHDTGSGKGTGTDWVVGRNPVLEAMQAGMPIRAAYVAEGAEHDRRLRAVFRHAAEHAISMLQVSRAELDRLTGGAAHQAVALKLPGYDYLHPDDLLATATSDQTREALVVALDGITDPHNLGAIARSAAAFGAHGVIIPQRRSASVTAVAWKASAGAIARVPVARATNLNRTIGDYRRAGFTAVGLAGEAETGIAGVPGVAGPLLVVIGSEGNGLARLTRERCDALARIPIAGTIESLNASVAAGIALYEITRRRGAA